MKELTLQEIKKTEVDILKVFHSFCVEHNIRYFISHGTLLGAIKYKGFIPWDDDVDVIVPREDYDKLLSIFTDSNRYHLYAFERNHKYRYPFAKLCDMDTQLIELIYPNTGVTLGVNIDIFPLDNWSNKLEKAKAEARRINKNMYWLCLTRMAKPNTNDPIKFMYWSIIMRLVKLIGSGFYIKKILKTSKKYVTKRSCYSGVKVWCLYGEREIIPANVFSDSIEVEFEGEKFPAPIGFDIYLTKLYGDYLPDPPIEMRKTHHSFKAYRL